jgi:hypothetical protein
MGVTAADAAVGPSRRDGHHKVYDAFISYAHADRPLAAALQEGLQQLARPWNQRPLAYKDSHHHSPAPAYCPSTQVRTSRGEHWRAGRRTAALSALPFALPSQAGPGSSKQAATWDGSLR